MTTFGEMPPHQETLPVEALDGEPRRLCLVGWLDGHAIVHVLSDAARVTIGRGAEADFVVAHPTVSRIHALVTMERGVCSIEDLGSRNGIRVRGSAEQDGAVPLGLGDTFEVGSVPFALQLWRPQSAAQWSNNLEITGPVLPDAAPDSKGPVTQPRKQTSRMAELLSLADRVAVGDINILILGETGVGKEILAERIHTSSPRAKQPFVKLNCAALPEPLLESELFGHERGSFTGAVSAKQGLLESADGGTVFLDEAGEMPTSVQVKLLRVIDERRVLRVGGLVSKAIDVRFIAATNRVLSSEVVSGRFRADLFFRLAGVSLSVPPLRDRRDEIPSLATLFASRVSRRLQRVTPLVITDAAVTRLTLHTWPGNIRELRNVVERAALLCADGIITERELHFDPFPDVPRAMDRVDDGDEDTAIIPGDVMFSSNGPVSGPGSVRGSETRALKGEVQEFERTRILDALQECAGNQTRAAKMLGMPRATFVKRLASFGIARPRKRG